MAQNRIRLLPEHVANQIAAGEVVERPASVVKELVENSLDAGATRITVEIVAAGRGLIRVVDDGIGMNRDDALLCLERHATSKIQTAADLSHVTTMGFRGEAIPSIASISRFTLTTRPRDEGTPTPRPNPGSTAEPGPASAESSSDPVPGVATQILIHGGKILEVKEAGAPHGTSLEIRNLFFNVPARRKFLRSDETERAHIQHWLTTAALAHPRIGFTLVMEGRTVWQLPPLPGSETFAGRLHGLRERLRLLVGDGLSLVPVDAEGELEAVRMAPATVEGPSELSPAASARIWGWIGSPGVSRGNRDDQHLFVNRRPVENRGLNAALMEGYHNALMKGRYPLCCLFLEIDPAEVDVNIHPAKREVKFHRERAVRYFVAEAVREALKAWHQPQPESGAPTRPPMSGDRPAPARNAATSDPTPNARAMDLPGMERQPPFVPVHLAPGTGPSRARHDSPPASTSAPVPAAGAGGNPERGPSPSSPRPVSEPALGRSLESAARNSALENTSTGSANAPIPASATDDTVPPAWESSKPAPPLPAGSGGPAPLLSVPLRLVGVVGRLYVVLESDRGLVLLDQHAAHERVLYEQMLRRVQAEGQAPSQRLLLPETIELSPKDAAFLRENLPALTRLGVGLSEFGERTFLLDALPAFVKSAQPRRFALELVDELRAAGASVNAWRLGEAVVAKTVCRHSVKANDPLLGAELEALLENLRRCDMPYTCPHGRPTLVEMNFRELERKFGRVTG